MTEISLAENVVRADMTAVDQIEAWGKLHEGGLNAQTIAARFGVAEGLVKQRLRLAGVAKPILEAFRYWLDSYRVSIDSYSIAIWFHSKI